MVSPPVTCDRLGLNAAILGLDPGEADPVRIILAAQLRLRRCRRGQVEGRLSTAAEVREIITAREALLRRAVGSLTRLGNAPSTSGRTLSPIGTAVAAAVRERSHQ